MAGNPDGTASAPALALYQPEIAGNVGAILRLAACYGTIVHIIEPCGFAFSDRALRRAGMDYADRVAIARHANFAAFHGWAQAAGRRIMLLSTAGDTALHAARFTAGDVLMVGRESAGVPPAVHAGAAARIHIPMRPGNRSLNVAMAAGIALTEALRQTEELPT